MFRQVEQLVGSLDERGVCEGQLKRRLQTELSLILADISPDPPQPPSTEGWLTDGPHVGARIRMLFAGFGESEGTVVGYLPADGDDPALWHIEHDDGEEQPPPTLPLCSS